MSPSDGFNLLKERVTRWERIAGIYILEAVDVPAPAKHGPEQEAFLRSFAAAFGFCGPEVGDAEWKHAEVFREEARQHLVEAMVGGAEIGHSCWDVPPVEAESLADEFLGLFGADSRFFCCRILSGEAQCLAPYARPDFYDYIFGGGCIAVDTQTAAIFWVLDND